MHYCLQADLHAPGRARGLLADLSDRHPQLRSCCDDGLLVLSELVTNAVRHGGGSDIDVELDLSGDALRIVVTQCTPGRTPRLSAATPAWTAESGRGLHLVACLARRWGAEPLPEGGLRVWADLPSAPAPA